MTEMKIYYHSQAPYPRVRYISDFVTGTIDIIDPVTPEVLREIIDKETRERCLQMNIGTIELLKCQTRQHTLDTSSET